MTTNETFTLSEIDDILEKLPHIVAQFDNADSANDKVRLKEEIQHYINGLTQGNELLFALVNEGIKNLELSESYRDRAGMIKQAIVEKQSGLVIPPRSFSINRISELISPAFEIPALSMHSTLNVARQWFRRHLEQLKRPKNIIASYMYDLAGFEEFTGPKPVFEVTSGDIAAYLDQSEKKATRKRRLTSLGAFFKYLTQTEKVLDSDPTENLFADFKPRENNQGETSVKHSDQADATTAGGTNIPRVRASG